MLNLLIVLLAVFVAAPAWSVICTITGPAACTMSSITDNNCFAAGTSNCPAPTIDDGFTIEGGTSEVISFDISDSTGAGGTFQIDFTPPGVAAMSTGPVPVTSLQNVEVNSYFAHTMNYDIRASEWTPLSGIDTETLQLDFGGDYGNVDILPAWITCTGNGSNITCGSLTELIAGVVPPANAGELIITGDWLHSSTNDVEILCKGGGKLTVDTDNEVRIRLPKGTVSTPLYGLNARAGCEVNMLGRWYPFGVESPALSSEPVGNEWPVGDVVPCAKALAGDIVTDCATAAGFMGIRYDDKWQPDDQTKEEDPFVKQSLALAAADVAGEQIVLQFVDHTFGTANDIANDVNAAYEVTVVDATDTGGSQGAFDDPMGIIFSLYQGDFDQAGSWPHSRINVVETAPLADVKIGMRDIQVTATSIAVIAADQFDYARRYLRFSDPNGEPECESYAILHIQHNASGDIITLTDTRGLAKDYATTDTAWIDNGMKCGDTFVLTHAIEIDSSTPILIGTPSTLRDSHIGNRGKMTMKGVRSLGIPDYQLFMADPDTQFSYMAQHDITKNTQASDWMFFYNTEKTTVGPFVSFSAGTATFFGGHGFNSSDSGLIHIRDVSARHLGDDTLVCDTHAMENTRELRVERTIIEMAHDDADTGAGLDSFGKCGVNLDKVLFSNSSDKTAVNAVVAAKDPRGICRINEVAVLSTNTAPALIAQDITAVDCTATNWFVAGIRKTSNLSGGLYPAVTNQFVVRDVTLGIPAAADNIGYGGTQARSVKNGYFDRVNTISTFKGFGRGIQTFQNIGIFDHNPDPTYGPTNKAVLAFTELPEPGFIFDQVTVAWRPDSVSATNRGFYNIADPDEYGTHSNFVFAGMHDYCSGAVPGSTSILGAIQFNGSQVIDGGGGWWNFFDNNWCLATSPQTYKYGLHRTTLDLSVLISTLRAGGGGFSQDDPRFYDPANGQFWPITGSFNQVNGIGMQKGAGICKRTWAMKVLDLDPECQSDGAGGGGGGGGMKSW